MNITIHKKQFRTLSDDENLDGYLKSKSLGNRNNVLFRYNLAVALEIIIFSYQSVSSSFTTRFIFIHSSKLLWNEYLGSIALWKDKTKKKLKKNWEFAFLLLTLSKYNNKVAVHNLCLYSWDFYKATSSKITKFFVYFFIILLFLLISHLVPFTN